MRCNGAVRPESSRSRAEVEPKSSRNLISRFLSVHSVTLWVLQGPSVVFSIIYLKLDFSAFMNKRSSNNFVFIESSSSFASSNLDVNDLPRISHETARIVNII